MALRPRYLGQQEFEIGGRVHGLFEAGEQEERADHLADGGEGFHFGASVLMRVAVLQVDDADDTVARDDRSREEGFEGVLGQDREVFEAGVVEGFPRDGEQAAFAGDPAGQAFGELKAHLAEGVSRMLV